MKTATIPAVRVEPEFRQRLHRLLEEGETLSEFVEAAVRASVRIRAEQGEFVARGLKSLSAAKSSGDYIDADEVLSKLQKKLQDARSASRRNARPR